MSRFKEQIAADIESVFLNADEFAEGHNLNGTVCTCVLQSPTAQEQFAQGIAYGSFEGISGRVTIVHVAKDNLPEVPVNGQKFKLDGRIMLVDTVVEDMGILSITLHENVSGMTAGW